MKLLALMLVSLFFAVGANADSWDLPTPITVVSSGGNYRLTVYPRQLTSQLAYFEQAVEGRENAGQESEGRHRCEAILEKFDGTFYRLLWRRALVNDVSPVNVLVADDGTFATTDNWHSLGYGDDAVVIYDAKGRLMKKFALDDFLTRKEIESLTHTVSSILWGDKHEISDDGTLQLHVDIGRDDTDPDQSGPETIRISMANGAILPRE